PIFAWFWLKGKCANCKAPYSFRYPLVELLMAVLFAGAAWRLGASWTLIEAFLFIFGVVCACFIDLDHMILPDKFTLSGIVIGLIGAALNPERSFLDAVYGVLAGGGFLWAVAYLYYVFRGREGMGGGDIKLLGWIGAVLGWKAVPLVILSSSILGSIVGLALASRTKDGMQYAIPFGPYLGGAALLYLLFDGSRFAEWYLSMHGF
ncbi:MAG: A24 family peptidase, partial [Bdellovibrionota bacterium]